VFYNAGEKSGIVDKTVLKEKTGVF